MPPHCSQGANGLTLTAGTALEVSQLVNLLPSYLFPDSATPRPVSLWVCAGVSLGGHSAWLAGAKGEPILLSSRDQNMTFFPKPQDPRISHLIPIVASPDYAALTTVRLGGALSAPAWPRSLDALVRCCDPARLPVDLWSGKRILALCGARDAVVPLDAGGTATFVRALVAAGAGTGVTLRVDDEAGHEITPRMLGWIVDWLWQQVLFPAHRY
jgi:hypothetical protein